MRNFKCIEVLNYYYCCCYYYYYLMTFIRGIYNYVSETNLISRVCNFVVILWLTIQGPSNVISHDEPFCTLTLVRSAPCDTFLELFYVVVSGYVCSNTFWMLIDAVLLCLLPNKLHLFSRAQHTCEDAVRININLCCVRLNMRGLCPECFWDGSSCPYYYWYHFYFTLLLPTNLLHGTESFLRS